MLFVSRNEPKKYRRGQIANAKSTKKRPFSYSHSRINKNGELPEFIANKQMTCVVTNQKNNTYVLTPFEGTRPKKHSTKSTHKEVEDLLEENMGLKKENHKLQGELIQLKGRIETKNKKSVEKGRQLGMEFEKELYWAGSKTHMISGIKYQYQKLKMKYEQQNKQIEGFKRTIRETKILQYQVIIEALEIENRRLADLIRKIQNQTPNDMLYAQRPSLKKSEQHTDEKYYKYVQLIQKMTKNQQLNKQTIREKQNKILFLQKLLIEKDNRDYNNSRKVKKMQKTIDQLKQVNVKSNEEINRANKINEYQKDEIKKKFQEEKEQIKSNFGKQRNDLQSQIESLLQDKKELEMSVTKLKKAASIAFSQQRKNTFNNSNNNNVNNLNSSVRRSATFLKSQQNDVIPITLKANKETSIAENMQQSNEQNEKQKGKKQKNKNRVMQTSAQKYSDEAKKLRKIHYSQIIEIAEFLKYRMMSKGISSEGIKKYFEREKKAQAKLVIVEGEESVDDEPQWQDQYMTMREVKQILKAEPFCLDESSAYLFSRYAIEDCEQEHVYCDQNNENRRQIIKSIIKAAVGNYEFPTQKQQLLLDDFKVKYLPNFIAALKTYYPGGKVSKTKFLQVLFSFGIQITQKFEDLLLCKVATNSLSMNQLQYQALSEI